ncbi:MAG: hypothetical protein ACRC50_00465 [Gaiella sp.]
MNRAPAARVPFADPGRALESTRWNWGLLAALLGCVAFWIAFAFGVIAAV